MTKCNGSKISKTSHVNRGAATEHVVQRYVAATRAMEAAHAEFFAARDLVLLLHKSGIPMPFYSAAHTLSVFYKQSPAKKVPSYQRTGVKIEALNVTKRSRATSVLSFADNPEYRHGLVNEFAGRK